MLLNDTLYPPPPIPVLPNHQTLENKFPIQMVIWNTRAFKAALPDIISELSLISPLIRLW